MLLTDEQLAVAAEEFYWNRVEDCLEVLKEIPQIAEENLEVTAGLLYLPKDFDLTLDNVEQIIEKFRSEIKKYYH